MENSEISWCDHTHNHWERCTKVSPGSTTNDSDSAIVRVGKKLSGRLLDGVRHDAFPTV